MAGAAGVKNEDEARRDYLTFSLAGPVPLNTHTDSLPAPPEGPRQPTSSPVFALPLTLHSTALPLRRCPCAGSRQNLCSSIQSGSGPSRHQCGINTSMHNHLWQCAAAGCAVLEGGTICRDVWLQGSAAANEQRHLTADCPECSAGSNSFSIVRMHYSRQSSTVHGNQRTKRACSVVGISWLVQVHLALCLLLVPFVLLLTTPFCSEARRLLSNLSRMPPGKMQVRFSNLHRTKRTMSVRAGNRSMVRSSGRYLQSRS